jgi:hypothetical protein
MRQVIILVFIAVSLVIVTAKAVDSTSSSLPSSTQETLTSNQDSGTSGTNNAPTTKTGDNGKEKCENDSESHDDSANDDIIIIDESKLPMEY